LDKTERSHYTLIRHDTRKHTRNRRIAELYQIDCIHTQTRTSHQSLTHVTTFCEKKTLQCNCEAPEHYAFFLGWNALLRDFS